MSKITKGSWKTSASGTALILTAIANVLTALSEGSIADVNWAVVVPMFITGIGLLVARDNNRSSEDVGAR